VFYLTPDAEQPHLVVVAEGQAIGRELLTVDRELEGDGQDRHGRRRLEVGEALERLDG
jgi:hypothetical protein